MKSPPFPVDQVAPRDNQQRAAVPVVREPGQRRVRVRDIARYGPVIRALASRDLKARYKQSALGPAWTVFQPLALLAAFTVGFHSVAHLKTSNVPYVLFALVGLAVWSYVQGVAMVASGSIVNSYALVRWTACPRLALPIASLVSNLPTLAVTGLAAVAYAAIAGYLWIGSLLFPVLMVWLIALVAAAAVFLSAVTVRARDVLSALPFLLQVGLFLSPVAYATNQLPGAARTLIYLNPVTGLIDACRWSLLGVTPDMTAVVVSLALTVVALVVAWSTFGAFEGLMADEI